MADGEGMSPEERQKSELEHSAEASKNTSHVIKSSVLTWAERRPFLFFGARRRRTPTDGSAMASTDAAAFEPAFRSARQAASAFAVGTPPRSFGGKRTPYSGELHLQDRHRGRNRGEGEVHAVL